MTGVTTDAPLRVSTEGGIRWLTLDRPDRRNALDRALATALLGAVVEAAADPNVRVMVLAGAGGAFCAGDDISQLRAMLDGDSSANAQCLESGDALYLRIAEELLTAPKPVVAAIDGACAGAGTELACAADLRLASDRARIGSGLLAIGQAGNGVTVPRVIGATRATELYLSAQLLPATEARAIGLVTEVLPTEGFREAVTERLRPLAEAATGAVGLFKELRERSWGSPVEHGLRLEEAIHRRCQRLQDAREGAESYLAGRNPRFSGR